MVILDTDKYWKCMLGFYVVHCVVCIIDIVIIKIEGGKWMIDTCFVMYFMLPFITRCKQDKWIIDSCMVVIDSDKLGIVCFYLILVFVICYYYCM